MQTVSQAIKTGYGLNRLKEVVASQIFMEIFGRISEMYSELEEDEEMVHPLQIASLLVDWMDPQKAM